MVKYMNNEFKKGYTSRTEKRLIEEQLEKTHKLKTTKEEENRQELKNIIFNDNKPNKKEKQKKPWFTNLVLALTFCLSLIFSLYLIYDSTNQKHQLYQIINAILILITSLNFIISFRKTYFYKKTKASIFTSLCIIVLIGFNGLYFMNIIKLPTQNAVPDFSNTTLSEAIKWAEANNIEYSQSNEYSDRIEKYNIINQSVKAHKLTKNVKKINFEVSNGPDYDKEVIITDMTDWNIDEAVKIIDENFLNNVTVNFEENNEIERDIITNQSKSGTIKRNDPITFTVSIGSLEDLKPISMKNLKNISLFKAILYLNRNGIDYELKYDFSNKIAKNNVIKSSVKKGETVSPSDKITLTISKGKKIIVPELKNKKMSEVTKWIIENNLKINYTDKYDDNTKNGYIIDATYKKDDIIEEETTVGITVSKGKLKMPKFKSLTEFKTWAEKYDIKYEVKEEFNNDFKKGEIIKFSVKTGKKISKDKGITAYVSKGKAITVPDFSGKTKNEITKECNNLNITCTFINEYNTGAEEGTSIGQNIKIGDEISEGDNIQITIATKKQEEVTKINKTTNTSKTSSNSNTQGSSKNNNSNNSSNQNSNTNTCKNYTLNLGTGNTGSQTKEIIIGQNPNLKFSWNPVTSCNNGETTSGAICSSSANDGSPVSSCNTIKITYVS